MPYWQHLVAQMENGRWSFQGYQEDLAPIEAKLREILKGSGLPARSERNGDMMLIVHSQLPVFIVLNTIALYGWELVSVVNLDVALNYTFKRLVK